MVTEPCHHRVIVKRLVDLPVAKRRIAEETVNDLSRVRNLKAVSLGGSHASGRATASSDLDFGLYYRGSSPFSIEDVAAVAKNLSVSPSPVVTDFYEWGPWVNGGAWIQTEHGRVDFLYRNLDQVERTIDDLRQGRIEHDYDQQPPYGFYNVIYLAEIETTIPLFDPDHELAKLKRSVRHYPEALRVRIVDDALWSAEFALESAAAAAAAADVYTTVGCLTRVLANLTQAIFALNEAYFLTDKRLSQVLESFDRVPIDYVGRMEQLLAAPGRNVESLGATVRSLRILWEEVVALADGGYKSRYSL